MENTEVVEIVEDVAGATLNKAVIIGAIVAGGAVLVVLAPKVLRKAKNLFVKKDVAKEDVVLEDNEVETE